MITLVGIGHVFSIKDAVKYLIFTSDPDTVCLELDRMRFDALESGNRDNSDLPFIFKRLQKVYDKAAETQGATVGEEMLGAAEAAEEMGIPHYFIDIEASPMVMNIFQKLSVAEKLKLFGSVLGASVLPKKTIEEGIKHIGENPEQYMDQFAQYFPSLKHDIVDYRDQYMSKKILEISRKHEHVLAVVGQGHVPGMSKFLKGYGLNIISLKDVQEVASKLEDGSLIMPKVTKRVYHEDSNNDVHFGFQMNGWNGEEEDQ
jgi:pheromone shutdown protein TraB